MNNVTLTHNLMYNISDLSINMLQQMRDFRLTQRSCRINHHSMRRTNSGVAKLEWARVQRFQKSKQVIPIFWQFLGRPNRPKVCHTSKSQRFPEISDETNHCRLVLHTIQVNFSFNKCISKFILIYSKLYLKKTTSGKFRPHSAGPVCIAHPAHPITTPLRTNH